MQLKRASNFSGAACGESVPCFVFRLDSFRVNFILPTRRRDIMASEERDIASAELFRSLTPLPLPLCLCEDKKHFMIIDLLYSLVNAFNWRKI